MIHNLYNLHVPSNSENEDFFIFQSPDHQYMKYPVILYNKRYTSLHAWSFASSLPLTNPPGLTSWSDLPCNWPPRQPRRSSFVLQRVARQHLDLSEAEWHSKFSHHGKSILCLWAAFFQAAGSSRPVRGAGRLGWGYKEKCQKNTDFWGFNFGQFSKKENANQNMDFWVSILANFKSRKFNIKKINFCGF